MQSDRLVIKKERNRRNFTSPSPVGGARGKGELVGGKRKKKESLVAATVFRRKVRGRKNREMAHLGMLLRDLRERGKRKKQDTERKEGKESLVRLLSWSAVKRGEKGGIPPLTSITTSGQGERKKNETSKKKRGKATPASSYCHPEKRKRGKERGKGGMKLPFSSCRDGSKKKKKES